MPAGRAALNDLLVRLRLREAEHRHEQTFGKPYAELTESEWSTMQSIASERWYGLNWVCGYAMDWDKVPTDT
jgi:hypothetical protein